MWFGGGRKKRRYPCTVEDPTISLYCRPRALAWRAPLHTQLRAVCEPQQTALRGSRNAVEEKRFCSDYQNRLTQYLRCIEPVPISNRSEKTNKIKKGDLEIVGYLRDATGPRNLVIDLNITLRPSRSQHLQPPLMATSRTPTPSTDL